MQQIKYVSTPQGITYFTKEKGMVSITETHPFFDIVQKALRNKNPEVLWWLVNPNVFLDHYQLNEIEYTDRYSYKGMELPFEFIKGLVLYALDQKPKEPLLNFLDKICFFPSYIKRASLLRNLYLPDLPLNEKGNLLLRVAKNEKWAIEGKSVSAIKELNENRSRRLPHFLFPQQFQGYPSESMIIEIDPRFLVALTAGREKADLLIQTLAFKVLEVF